MIPLGFLSLTMTLSLSNHHSLLSIWLSISLKIKTSIKVSNRLRSWFGLLFLQLCGECSQHLSTENATDSWLLSSIREIFWVPSWFVFMMFSNQQQVMNVINCPVPPLGTLHISCSICCGKSCWRAASPYITLARCPCAGTSLGIPMPASPAGSETQCSCIPRGQQAE